MVLGAVGTVVIAGTGQPTHTPTPPVAAMDAASVSADAGADAGGRVVWLRMLNGSANSDDEPLALGPPDGRCAVVRPNGKIVIELTPGLRQETDSGAEADLEVVVVESRSGPYRVDVSMTRHQTGGWTNVGLDVIGSAPFDVDEFQIHRFRYIRVKNASTTSLVCVDAVGLRIH